MSIAESLFKKGELAFNKEQYEYAKELLSQLVLLEPDNVKARKLLYTANVARVGAQAGKSASKLTMSFKGTKLMGELAITRNPQKKIELAQRYLNDDPFNSKIRLMLARALMEEGHLDGALEETNIVVEKEPNNAEAYKIMGTVYIKQNMMVEAQKAFDVVRRLTPGDRELDKLVRDLAATTTMRKGFESARSYREVIKDKDKAEQLEKMQHMIKTKEDVINIIKNLEADLQEDPDNVKIMKSIADNYFGYLKDYKTALKWFEKALAKAPEDSLIRDKIDDCKIMELQSVVNSAKTLDEKKKAAIERFKFELKSYERRVADRPTDSVARFELGRRYMTAKMYDKAISEFQQSMKDPKYKTRSLMYLGISFQKKALYDVAQKQFELAEALCSSQDELLEIWYNRGNCYESEKNLANALDMYKKVMQVNIKYKDVADKIAVLQKNLRR